MGSLNNQKPWVPYMNTKDCSQGFCSLYCPQWCYIWPPPPPFEFPDDNSGPNFSPLVIAIIGILASALLLVSYYAIISKYCRNRNSTRRENQYPVMESEENLQQDQDPANHEPWHVPSDGLDESLIKSITLLKYKKGDGWIDGTDCSVCLSEFEEDDSLRLLPKCSHAFHALCIDTWLKSHSNCPLCRANIVLISPLPPISQTIEFPVTISPDRENAVDEQDVEIEIRESSSEINNLSENHGDMVMENRKIQGTSSGESGDDGSREQMRRRSVSMDYLCTPDRLSIAEILQIHDEEEEEEDDEQSEEEERYRRFREDVGIGTGTSKQPLEEDLSRSNNRNMILHYVVASPNSMKRSYSNSSGRFLFPKRALGRNVVLPL